MVILLFRSFVELTLSFLFLAYMYVLAIASLLVAILRAAFICSYFAILSIVHRNGKRNLRASMQNQPYAPVQHPH